MILDSSINNFTIFEEIWHAVTHGIGLALSIAGLVVLVVFASLKSNATAITASAIYGASLVVMYGSSTLYHAVKRPSLKKVFQTFDHASIYFLIAGSYTPISLVILRDGWGWSIFGVNWFIAIVGIFLKFAYPGRFEKLSLVLYVVMGWMIVIAFEPLVAHMPTAGLIWLVGGGLFYSFGVVFYLKDHKPYFHTVWHLFVLAGSLCHFFMTLFYIV
jgi:hemolysin III